MKLFKRIVAYSKGLETLDPVDTAHSRFPLSSNHIEPRSKPSVVFVFAFYGAKLPRALESKGQGLHEYTDTSARNLDKGNRKAIRQVRECIIQAHVDGPPLI